MHIRVIVLLLLCRLSMAAGTSLPAVGTEDLRQLSKYNSDFAFTLYKMIAGNKGNIFYSPLSISLAFAMLHLGSDSVSKSELEKVFHFEDTSDVHTKLKTLSQRLITDEADEFVLKLANKLYGEKTYTFLQDFLDDTRDYYGASLESLDFKNDAEASRTTINKFVESTTNDMIKDLIPAGVIKPRTVIVLVNAIYFKASWLKEFKQTETSPEEFTTHTAEKKTLDMMHMKTSILYGENEDLGCKFIELFYEGNATSMVLFLPKTEDGPLDSLQHKLSAENLNTMLSSMKYEKDVRIAIPKFKIAQNLNLKKILSSCLKSIFDVETADLSKITGKQNLYVSDALHKAVVEVNEEGTEAAGATAIVVSDEAYNQDEKAITFLATRPFMFILRERETGAVLFVGRVGDPTDEDSSINQAEPLTAGKVSSSSSRVTTTVLTVTSITLSMCYFSIQERYKIC